MRSVEIPAQNPNCNPHAERFVKTIRYERLNHFVFFDERHLRYVIKEFVEHYLAERFHQGIGGELIRNQPGSTNDNGASGQIARLSPSTTFCDLSLCLSAVHNVDLSATSGSRYFSPDGPLSVSYIPGIDEFVVSMGQLDQLKFRRTKR